jgi:hypothetical protein
LTVFYPWLWVFRFHYKTTHLLPRPDQPDCLVPFDHRLDANHND